MRLFSNALNTQTKITPAIYHKSENDGKGKFEKLAEILTSLEEQKPTSVPSHQEAIVDSFVAYYKKQEPEKQNRIWMIFDCVKKNTTFQPETKEELRIFDFFYVANENRNSSRFFAQSETATMKKLETWMPRKEKQEISSSSCKKNDLFESVGRNEKIIIEMKELLSKRKFLSHSKYIDAVKIALFHKDLDQIIAAISNTQPKSLKTDLDYQTLLYLGLSLVHNQLDLNPDLKEENPGKHKELNSFKKKLETILKNNPNSDFANKIRQEHFELTKKVLDVKCKLKKNDPEDQYDGKIQVPCLNSKKIFECIQPILPKREDPTLTKKEQLEYAKKLGLTKKIITNGGLTTVEKPSKEFYKVLKASKAEAKSLFLTANPALIEGADFRRSRDQRFAVSASDARYKGSSHVNNGALVNHYDQIEENGKTSRFRCGAVHTQNAARQYVVKMLLENQNQISEDNNTINLIDTRYLDILLPGKVIGDGKRFKKHKKNIENAINELKGEDGKISSNKLRSMVFDLAKQKLLVERVDKEFKSNPNIFSLEDLEKLDGKEIKFFPLDLGPSSKDGPGHMVHTFEDSQTVKNLNALKAIFEAKLSVSNNPEVKGLLKDLRSILTPNEEGLRPAEFVAGYRAFLLDEIIGRLSFACGMVSSAGCKSNKDRGSSAYMFHCIVSSVFAHRHANKQENFSLKDFELKDDAEKQLARNVISTNEVHSITLGNTGSAGNKCPRLNWLIEQAFGSKEELKAYEKLQEGSKFAKH